jgi:hypothetical protein
MFLDFFLALKLCSKAILSFSRNYGKSPCLSRSGDLSFAEVDSLGSPFTVLYIEVFWV